MIQQLPSKRPDLWRDYQEALHDADAMSKHLRASGQYPLTARGDINTYAVFAERFTRLIRAEGRVGAVLPTGIATDDTTKDFFAKLMETRSMASFLGMDNEATIYFPGIDHRNKFGLITVGGTKVATPSPIFTFSCSHIEDTRKPERRFTLTDEDIRLLNPNTRTCAVFRTRADAELTKKIYRRVPVLIDEARGRNDWGIRFLTMFHMANDSELFETAPGHALDPLYEAKMMHHFDHRYATYEGATQANVNEGSLPQPSEQQKQDPAFKVLPRYWLPTEAVDERLGVWRRRWLFAFRDIASNVVERTVIFSLLPRIGVGHTAPLMFFADDAQISLIACLLANVNSLTFDYVTRQKVGGTHLTYFILKQLPPLAPSFYTPEQVGFLVPRAIELACTAWDIQAFLDDVWREADEGYRAAIERQWSENREATGGHTYDPPEWYTPPEDRCPLPPFKWDEGRRARLRAELDAYYAKLYGLDERDLRYILDPTDVYGPDFPGETFRVLKEKEIARFGEYRTRRLVLEAWERLHQEGVLK